jgi:hypothetical protein
MNIRVLSALLMCSLIALSSDTTRVSSNAGKFPERALPQATGPRTFRLGEFSIDRSDFKVKATSAFHGMIRVRNRVKFTFDIVGREV